MSNLTSCPPATGDFAASVSSLATYRECPRKYEYDFLRMLAPEADRASFLIGEMVHKGLEAFYKKEHPKKIVQEVQDELYKRLRANFVPSDEMDALDKEVSIIIGMLMGYFKHYGPAEWSLWNNPKTEVGFDFEWVDGATRFMGMIDLIGENTKDGQLWVVEHKTTGLSGNEFLSKWHLGFQPHAYVWAGYRMHQLGMLPRPPIGCVINVLKKPGIRRKQTETQDQFNERLTNEYLSNPEKYMTREWIPIGEAELAWFTKTQGEWVRRLSEDYKRMWFPQNTDACYSHFGHCKFFPICQANGRDDGIWQYFRLKDKPFEEIEHVTATDR